MIKARDLEAGVETSREYEQRTRVEFWLRRATDLEQQLARVTADRDAAQLALGEMRRQERLHVRQLRAENERLRRERDEALARAEKAEGWRRVVKRSVGTAYLAGVWAAEQERGAGPLSRDDVLRRDRSAALDEMVRAGKDGGLYDLPEDAKAERWCNCGATGTWHPWGDTPHCAMAAESHAESALADRSEAPSREGGQE